MNTIELTSATTSGTLGAALDLPDVDPPWPCVLLLAGSGPTDRDGRNPLSPEGVDILRQIGAALAEHGIATVRPDKRGIGSSAAAAPAEHEMTIDRLVDDAAGWLQLIDGDPRMRTVVLAGHSEGALIAALAAHRHEVDGYVSLSGTARPAAALLREQLHGVLPTNLATASDTIIDALIRGGAVDDVPVELAAIFRPSVQPYLVSWLGLDPTQVVAGLEVPTLLVHGDADRQVPVDDAHRLLVASPRARLHVAAGVDHLLRVPPSTRVDTGIVEVVVGFVAALG